MNNFESFKAHNIQRLCVNCTMLPYKSSEKQPSYLCFGVYRTKSFPVSDFCKLCWFSRLPRFTSHTCYPCASAGYHDDVFKWQHFPRYWPFVRGSHQSPVNSPHKGQWRRVLMFSVIYAWINGWGVNKREAGDLRLLWRKSLPFKHIVYSNWHRNPKGVLKIVLWELVAISCATQIRLHNRS